MARQTPRPRPTLSKILTPVTVTCPHCQRRTRADYTNFRTLTQLNGVWRFTLRVRRCHNSDCPLHLRPYRPEVEGRHALPHHEFGLDVLALVGQLHHAEHCASEIHRELLKRGLALAQRTVTNLPDRYHELCALRVADPARLRQQLLDNQASVVLALDGLRPDVGREVLWVLRDCVTGAVLLAKSLVSATQKDLTALLTEVRGALPVPITVVVYDGQQSIRKAAEKALADATHQFYHRPIYLADRHAKK